MTNDRLDLRISSDLKDRLKAAAKADGRSLSNFCIRVLEQALSDSPTGGETREAPDPWAAAEALAAEKEVALREAERLRTPPAAKPYTPPRPKGKR